jgi:hypothetical protein
MALRGVIVVFFVVRFKRVDHGTGIPNARLGR